MLKNLLTPKFDDYWKANIEVLKFTAEEEIIVK